MANAYTDSGPVCVAGSMARDGVRDAYPVLLCVTLVVSCLLFSLFGVLGYGSYGDSLCRYDGRQHPSRTGGCLTNGSPRRPRTHSSVCDNISSLRLLFHFGSVILTNLEDGPATDVVRVSLIVGLFFTYGFQMFPILEVRHHRHHAVGKQRQVGRCG